MLVSDRHRSSLPLPELARRAVEGGVDAVQVREKGLPRAELGALTLAVRVAVGGRAALLINGDVALAAELGCGVHLPEDGASPAIARRRLGPAALIGRSVHSVEAAHASAGADYLLAGHVFATASKPGTQPLGVDGLRRIVAASALPVLAIGGIEPANVAAVLAVGACGVAVISAISGAPEPELAAAALRNAIEEGDTLRMEQTTIRLRVNGKEVALPTGATISDFLREKGLHERQVAIELNGTIVPRREFGATCLNDGDRVEVVHAVGGG